MRQLSLPVATAGQRRIGPRVGLRCGRLGRPGVRTDPGQQLAGARRHMDRHVLDGPDAVLLAQPGTRPTDDRPVVVAVGHHEMPVELARPRHELVRLLGGGRERLLDEHVGAGLHGGERVFVVEGGRAGDDGDVGAIAEHLGVVLAGVGEAPGGTDALQRLGAVPTHAPALDDVTASIELWQVRRGDPRTGADHDEPQLAHRSAQPSARSRACQGHSNGDGLDALDHDAVLLVSFPGTITRRVAPVKPGVAIWSLCVSMAIWSPTFSISGADRPSSGHAHAVAPIRDERREPVRRPASSPPRPDPVPTCSTIARVDHDSDLGCADQRRYGTG